MHKPFVTRDISDAWAKEFNVYGAARRRLILLMYEHRVWMNYKYKSWAKYVRIELSCTYRYSYDLITLAMTEQEMALGTDVHLPDSHLRILSVLVDGELMRKAYELAKEITRTKVYKGKGKMHQGKMTAVNIREAVREVQELPRKDEEDKKSECVETFDKIFYIRNEQLYMGIKHVGSATTKIKFKMAELDSCEELESDSEEEPTNV